MFKTIIGIPLCGFANRLKFMASIDGFAKKYKCKKILILWRPTINCNIAASDVFKKIPNIEFIDELPNDKEQFVHYGYIHLKEIFHKIKEDKITISDEKILVVEGGHEAKHHDINLFDFVKQKHKFYKSILWSNKILDLKKNLGDIPPIGIHYRHNNKNHDEADIKANPLVNFTLNSPFSEFEKAIKRCKQKAFFISNSSYHKKYIDENYSKKVTIINMDENNDRSEKDSMINSILEFILLTECDTIIGTFYSSFSDECLYFDLKPKIIPMLPEILDNENVSKQYCEAYHSELKPVKLDHFFVINPDFKKITETF